MRTALNLSFVFLVGFEIQSSFGQTSCAGCSVDATCGHTFIADTVYGCDGTWTDVGVSNGEYLCGDGYSICVDPEYTEDTLGLTLSLCTDSSIPTNSFYVTLASSDGSLDCSQPGSNDLFGCASGTDEDWLYFDSSAINCGPFGAQLSTTGYGDAWQFGWELNDAWNTDPQGTNELDEVTHLETQEDDGSGNWVRTTVAVGGVLCCTDQFEMAMFSSTEITIEPIVTEGGEGDSNAYSIKIQFCGIWIIFMIYYFC